MPFVCFNRWPYNFDTTVDQFVLFSPPPLTWGQLSSQAGRSRELQRAGVTQDAELSIFVNKEGNRSQPLFPHMHVWATVGSPAWIQLVKLARACFVDAKTSGLASA